MAASQTDGQIYEGKMTLIISMSLAGGIIELMRSDKGSKLQKDFAEIVESWDNPAVLAPFAGVWVQVAESRKFQIS